MFFQKSVYFCLINYYSNEKAILYSNIGFIFTIKSIVSYYECVNKR
jgi:hypothetical protein